MPYGVNALKLSVACLRDAFIGKTNLCPRYCFSNSMVTHNRFYIHITVPNSLKQKLTLRIEGSFPRGTNILSYVYGRVLEWRPRIGKRKVADSSWMRVAEDRVRWRAIGEAYVQQWTAIGWWWYVWPTCSCSKFSCLRTWV